MENQETNQAMENQEIIQDPNPEFYVEPPVADNNLGKGMATASLVLGILGLLFFCCCTYLGIILGALAIIFACVSRSQAGYFRGLAMAGLILGIIATLISIVAIIASVAFLANGTYDSLFEDLLYTDSI